MSCKDWLDIHGHFYPPQAPGEAEALAQSMRDACFMVNGPVTWDVQSILDYNDRANIQMQMLSYIPQNSPEKLIAANTYAAAVVKEYPDRFGLLGALPTDDPDLCLKEIERLSTTLIPADGFATSTVYNGVGLSDSHLDPVWEVLNARKAVVHIHPNAYAGPSHGRPSPLIEVAFDTARTCVDMLYKGVFRRYPEIKFVLGHCGGALPVLSGRLSLLGTESWVPNPNNLTREEIEKQLRGLYVDTAATAKTGLPPAVQMVGVEHVIYGADCGVPCSTEQTMEENKADVLRWESSNGVFKGMIMTNGWHLFPQAAIRAGIESDLNLWEDYWKLNLMWAFIELQTSRQYKRQLLRFLRCKMNLNSMANPHWRALDTFLFMYIKHPKKLYLKLVATGSFRYSQQAYCMIWGRFSHFYINELLYVKIFHKGVQDAAITKFVAYLPQKLPLKLSPSAHVLAQQLTSNANSIPSVRRQGLFLWVASFDVESVYFLMTLDQIVKLSFSSRLVAASVRSNVHRCLPAAIPNSHLIALFAHLGLFQPMIWMDWDIQDGKCNQLAIHFRIKNLIYAVLLQLQCCLDDRHSPQKESETKKMAIPRLPEGTEASLSSLGRFHRRHVRRACESCRQRKTKCTGDKSGCRNCREAGIICCYTDGKREKSKRQLATLSAKVQTYEEVIRKMSLRFGVSEEQLMNNAISSVCPTTPMTAVLSEQSDASSTLTKARSILASDGSQRRSQSPSARSSAGTDRVEEDFNKDSTSRATGYIGNSSEMCWLQKLRKKVNGDVPETGQSSPPPTPPGNDDDGLIASINFYADNKEFDLTEDVQSGAMPPKDTASQLLRAYWRSIHLSFPIIGRSTFQSQFNLFFSQPGVKPGNKWLAILNLIFATSAVYARLVGADWKLELEHHSVYFKRARILSMRDTLFDHPDLQQLQIEGLTSFYLLSTGQINRSWKVSGSAVRGAISLGLHLRNVGSTTSDTSKEIRYRVWWALYTLDHMLNVITGRPSCIVDGACTTPIPIPFDETEFQKPEAAQMLSNHTRKGSWINDWNPSSSSLPSPSQNGESSTDNTVAIKSEGESSSSIEWLKSLPVSCSLYFFYVATLASISKRANMKLYSGEAMQASWASLEFTIQSLSMEIDAWLASLPETFDFRLPTPDKEKLTISQKMGMAFAYYSAKISISRPCLCQLEKDCQTDGAYEFCNKTAAECVDAATRMINILPATMDTSTLYKISPWWCTLHYIMQATTVLLLELSFRAEHVPERAGEVSQALKKAVKWLFELSHSSDSAHRAWKLSDEYLRNLAPPLNLDISDLPDSEILMDSSNNFVSVLENSLLDQQVPALMPYLETDTLDFLETQQTDGETQGTMQNNAFDDFLPYDPSTGQITGSFFPSSSTSNLDMDFDYMWDSSVF
ncbi:C6 transcription factor, putative [Talaromyces stipitatus ATCC 10500]|uniref:C6 transcription factor, putative n=1 Tax=Talaromyces stipitatus (strain ATCC 10500 / CBS 375.48 / QM 6759 / NRRL 1006) TaxID=441959 RepID=B8M1Z2_TALSN|nr:C6 transcription factor, putative [Talaromyces stipitatus ATCC 10500]EED21370.1 C6 transcription factor, putative [Talaromyces stipitatus ATCC 10500]